MPLSRALLLKGLGGLTAASAAAVGAYGAMHPKKFADFFKSQNQINEEQKKKAKDVNEKLKTLGLTEEDCKLETSDFTTSSDYSKECELDQAKFKKIKFSNAGDNDVEVDGWTDSSNSIKLKISNKSNGGIRFLFKDVKDDLTITKSSTEKNEKITIRKERETEFEIKDDKLSKVVDQAFKAKLDGINKKMVGAGLPTDCSFDITEKDKTLECGLDDAKLKAIKFSNKQDNQQLTVTGTVGNDLKIKVEVKDKEDDPSISFTGLSQDLTILGESTKGKIVIKKEGDRKFRVSGEKLEKVSLNEQAVTAKLEKINQKLSTLSLPNDCRFDVAEQDKVLECGLDANKLKAIKFSNKGDTGSLTLSNETVESTLKVKIEAKDNEDDATFSFTGLTQDLIIYGDKTKGKIILKSSSTSPERTFKEKSGKLEKVAKDAEKAGKLKGINGTLNGLDLPNKCRFDENDEDSSFECDLSFEDFKKIKLTSKDEGGNLNVSEGSDLTKMKLKVELKKNKYTDEDEIFYTISDLDKKLKFGKTGEEIIFDTGKSYGFEIKDNKFRPKGLLAGIVSPSNGKFSVAGIDCTYTNNSYKGTCTASMFVDLLFDENGGDVVDSVTWTGKQESFEFWDFQEGYAENIKFTYKGTTHSTKVKSQERKLEHNKDYELKQDRDKIWRLKEKP